MGLQNAHGKRTLKKFREAAQKTRPTLLETTIGLDVVIPGKVLLNVIGAVTSGMMPHVLALQEPADIHDYNHSCSYKLAPICNQRCQ